MTRRYSGSYPLSIWPKQSAKVNQKEYVWPGKVRFIKKEGDNHSLTRQNYSLPGYSKVAEEPKKGRVTTIRIAPKKEALSINETYTKPSTVWYREISSNKLKQISL